MVEKLVGEGGFAVVYRANHNIWNKPVAIKFFSELSSAPVDQREELMESFVQEGALLTELSSQTASIVQARDVGTYTTPEGRWMPYMVLEWLEGRSLEEVLDDERAASLPNWSLTELLRVIHPAAQALDVAHGRGIAHRDVKPANIFVLGPDARSPDVTVKILDFGVAKMITDNTQMKAALAKTGTNITSFTPQYGAPEQFSRSYGATGPWTDVFALALVAIELLRGKPAMEGDDLIQLAYTASNPAQRPTPRGLGLSVPDAVEAVFAKALAMQPAQRYARAGEFLTALEAAIGGTDAQYRDGALSGGAGPGEGFGLAHTVAATDPSLAGLASTGGNVTTNSPAMLVTAAPQPVATRSRAPLAIAAVAVGVLALGGVGVFVAMSSTDGKAATSAQAPSAPPPASASAAPAPATCPNNMVKIPAGQFYMGSDQSDAMDNEKPAHNVMLNAFCIDTFEVTRDQYLTCSQNGACPRAGREASWPEITDKERAAYSPLCNGEAESRGNHPINCVTWRDAEAFCRKNGKRLPTEAEWEYATRGPDGRVYPWGDEAPTHDHLNACDKDCEEWAKKAGVRVDVLFEDSDGFAATAPVGSFPAGRSRFGPFDVVGNVWEWVADYYGPYGPDELKNPKGPAKGEKRVIRGGAWNGGYATWLRPSFRYANDPKVRSPAIGFRCAKSLE